MAIQTYQGEMFQKKGNYISSLSIVQQLYINFLNYIYCIISSILVQYNFCNEILKQ